MSSQRPGGRAALARVLLVSSLCIAVAAGFFAGYRYQPAQRAAAAAGEADGSSFDVKKGFPRPDAPRPVDPRQAEPAAVEARATAIRRDIESITAECRRAAGGDWDRWQRDTARYRTDLRTKVESLKALHPTQADNSFSKWAPLEGRDDFPLFEMVASVNIDYLYDPASLDQFRKERAVVAAHRWLRERGIDLIFVALPKMTEVYIDHFIDPCPPDGIIAPHVRRTLLELLESDVEVVEGFRPFRSFRDAGDEYLYQAADTHWAPRAMRILAKVLADRIERYRFGARARYGLPIAGTTLGPSGTTAFVPERGKWLPTQYGWAALTPEQWKRAESILTTTDICATTWDGQDLNDDPNSPVLLVGHSYLWQFDKHFARELNMRINVHAVAARTTEVFRDFLREPDLLAHCRVVVWITTGRDWPRFPPLPPEITGATGK
jgi:hypothetical protein